MKSNKVIIYALVMISNYIRTSILDYLSMNKLMDKKLYPNFAVSDLLECKFSKFREPCTVPPLKFKLTSIAFFRRYSSSPLSPHLKIGPVICRLNITAFYLRVDGSSLAIFEFQGSDNRAAAISWEGKSIAVLGVKRWDFLSCQRNYDRSLEAKWRDTIYFFRETTLGVPRWEREGSERPAKA